MKAAEAILAGAAALFALLPGLNSILGGAGATPGDEKLFGGVSVAVGVGTLLAVTMFKAKIRRVSRRKIAIGTAMLLVATIGVLAAHVGMLANVIVVYQIDGTPTVAPRAFLFPLRAEGKLANMIAIAGGRLAALYRYGPDAISAALLEPPNPTHSALTKGLLLFTFSSISAGFSAALLILAYRSQPSA